VRTADVLFLNEMLTGALVCPTGVTGNVTLDGVTVVGLTPVPVGLMTCGLSAALSIIVILAVRLPNADGVNEIEIVHVEPAPSDDPHVLVCANSGDDELMLEIVIALIVLLVKEMARGGLV